MILNPIKFILQAVDTLKKLQQSPYHIFIRAKGMEVVGILTKIEHRYDPGWGIMRSWAKGIKLNGDTFEEPLDRKNKRTGELEDLIQMRNDLVIITARNSPDPDDDNDDNFQYLMNPYQVNEIKDSLDRVKEKDRIIHDLQKRLKEAIEKANRYQAEAESATSELNTLRERVRNLSERLAEQTQRAEDYKRQLKELQIGMIREESKLDEQLKTSEKLGRLEGKDSADIIIDATKKQIEARRELDKLGLGGLTAYATKEDLERLKDEII
ncbi:MAG: hypothetical protein DRP18_03220 [Candidatus Aenigmatarchaeota archaeon]|nr:MAG: hypothetical protein DRP18_03220 [Candidatus Aenigmarchaeota archaeon]